MKPEDREVSLTATIQITLPCKDAHAIREILENKRIKGKYSYTISDILDNFEREKL